MFAILFSIFLLRRHGFAGSERVLPLTLKEWQPYEGVWTGDRDIIANLRNGRGDKLISSLTMPDDLAFSAEMRFDSESDMQWGDAGIVARVTNPAQGTDAFNGYYFGLRPFSRELLLGRVEFDYVNLAVEPLKEPLELGAWYQMELRVKGCHLEATARNSHGENIGSAVVDDRKCRNASGGSVGLRSYSMLASWRHLLVRRLH